MRVLRAVVVAQSSRAISIAEVQTLKGCIIRSCWNLPSSRRVGPMPYADWLDWLPAPPNADCGNRAESIHSGQSHCPSACGRTRPRAAIRRRAALLGLTIEGERVPIRIIKRELARAPRSVMYPGFGAFDPRLLKLAEQFIDVFHEEA
jgi:hypothetical protein